MISLVKVISSEIDGLKNRVVKFLRLGKYDFQTSAETGPYGIDSSPIKNMRAVYAETGSKGETVIVGYINKNQLAGTGEVRLYSTDENGTQKIYVWLKKNGQLELGGNTKHMTRFEELETGFNKLRDDFNDLVSKFNLHMHPTAGSGPPSVQSGDPAELSTADISNAKIEEILTL